MTDMDGVLGALGLAAFLVIEFVCFLVVGIAVGNIVGRRR